MANSPAKSAKQKPSRHKGNGQRRAATPPVTTTATTTAASAAPAQGNRDKMSKKAKASVEAQQTRGGKRRSRPPRSQREQRKRDREASILPASQDHASAQTVSPPPTAITSDQLSEAVTREVEEKQGTGPAKGIQLAIKASLKRMNVAITEKLDGRNGYVRVAAFFDDYHYSVFNEIHANPCVALQKFPSLVRRFRMYATDASLSRATTVRIGMRKGVPIVYLDCTYACELLAALSFTTFGFKGVHGRTYGDFLLGWFLPTDVLLSCDKTILENSREGRPPGFFDDVNDACAASAKHASREDRKLIVFDIYGLRTTSLGNSAYHAEAMAAFLTSKVKGRTACCVCGSFRHEKPCVKIDDLHEQ
jgi:hypothetical protein